MGFGALSQQLDNTRGPVGTLGGPARWQLQGLHPSGLQTRPLDAGSNKLLWNLLNVAVCVCQSLKAAVRAAMEEC